MFILIELMIMVLPLLVAGLAMVACLKFGWGERLRKPIDAGFLYGESRWLGDNKTWLGPVVMSTVTAVVGMGLLTILQLFGGYGSLSVVEAVVGFWLVGIAYSMGELLNSFIKRRRGIAPGKLPEGIHGVLHYWIDLFDGLLMAGVIYYIYFGFDWRVIVWAMGIGGLVHWIIEQVMIRLHLKQT